MLKSNERILIKVLLLLSMCVNLFKCDLEVTPVYSVEFSKRTRLACFRTHLGMSLRVCLSRCLTRRDRCTHVRHNRLYRICSLCENSINFYETKQLPGDVVISVNENIHVLSNMISKPCRSVTCARTQRCIKTTGECQFSECEFPAEVKGTNYPDKIIAHVGAKVKFDCQDNTIPECPIIQKCKDGALWSGGEITSVLFGSGNTAQNGHATQSSTWEGGTKYQSISWGAEKAINGRKDTNIQKDFDCTHGKAEPRPWWRVDLSYIYWIARVVIYNRSDYVPERLHDVVVTVGIDLDNMALCGVYTGPGTFENIVISIACEPIRYGRFVQIQITQGTNNVLTLCEVEIFSE